MSNSVNLALDVNKTGIQNTLIKVRQGDGGFETLHTTVTSNGEPMDLQGWTITFMGTTAGNHKIIDANVKIVEAPNGIFEYTPSKVWGMDIGYFKIAYFKFVKGDGSASSANFRVSVIEAVDLTQEEAQNYISVVDATISEIDKRLNDSLANVTQSIAETSSATSLLAVNVSSVASSAVNQINDTASSAVYNVDSVASNVVNNVNSTASIAVDNVNNTASNAVNNVNVTASNATNSITSSVNALGNRVNDYNEKLASVKVGGRNLLLNTNRSFTGTGSNTTQGSFDAQGGQYFLAGGKRVSDLYKQYGSSGYLTLSFDWVASGDNISGQFSSEWSSTPWSGIGDSRNNAIKPSTTNTSGHYKITVPLNTSGYSTGIATGIRFRQDNLQGNVTISNVKLEAGNVATDWTPAPEDAPSNDAQLVHKTGTETIAGDKTFAGNTTILAGNYGLRVTASGIQKTTDGKTWVAANI